MKVNNVHLIFAFCFNIPEPWNDITTMIIIICHKLLLLPM